VRIRFLAVAWDEQGNDMSDRATFTWTFSDAKEPIVGNPVLHRFPELGKFLVAVTATLDSDSGCDQTTVIVIPYEGGGLRQVPEVDDFTVTANGHESGAEVAEQVGDLGPWWWGATSFSATRMETLYVPATSTTLCH
jgi:hypothetical protein